VEALGSIITEIKTTKERLREYYEWFISQKLAIPKIPFLASSKRRMPEESKKVWRKTRTEFAAFIAAEYHEHKENYESLTDAVKKIYPQYKFSFRWSKQNCYELAKKQPYEEPKPTTEKTHNQM